MKRYVIIFSVLLGVFVLASFVRSNSAEVEVRFGFFFTRNWSLLGWETGTSPGSGPPVANSFTPPGRQAQLPGQRAAGAPAPRRLPLGLVIIGAFTLGFLLSLLLDLKALLAHRLEVRGLKAKLTELTKEIHSLRNLPLYEAAVREEPEEGGPV